MEQKLTYEELEHRVNEPETLEVQRRHSLNNFDRFFNLSIDMLCIADVKGYFLIVNDAFEKTLQYSKQELYEKPYIHFVHPADLDSTKRALKKLAHGEPVTYFENRYRCKDGSYKWLGWTSMPVAADGITYAVARDVTAFKQAEQVIMECNTALEQRVKERTAELRTANEQLAREIEERKQAQNALQHSKQLLEIIINNIPHQVFWKNRDSVYLGCNQRFADVTGMGTPENVVGKTDFEFGRKSDHAQSYREWDQKIMSLEKPVIDLKEAFHTSEGLEGTALTSKVPLHDEQGEIFGLLGICTDITEHLRMQEQLQQAQKMEAIGTLAGGIAHDFNNILAAIMGYTEMSLDETPHDSLVHHNLEQILLSTLRARDLVKQILTFSRKGERKRKPVQLAALAGEALKLLRASIPATIEIRQHFETDALIMADPIQIHQVLMNLCANASDAMRESGGVLEVRIAEFGMAEKRYVHDRVLPPGIYVWVRIKDTGCGIAPENIGHIFEPFFTTKASGEGTGMGLAVVHGIVHGHDGAITAKSRPGEGTTFELFFPRIEREPEANESPATAPPFGDETILLVDDEQMVLDVAVQMIESFGYTVVACSSSLQALETFREDPQRFDLVVTDYFMPKMTGYDLSKKLIEIRPDVPVILCTGYSESVSTEKARDAGIKEFVLKPVGRNEIANILRKVLDERGENP